MTEKPCDYCKKVACPAECENKTCREWKAWFLDRWEKINGYYEKMQNAECKVQNCGVGKPTIEKITEM